MATKPGKISSDARTAAPLSGAVKESAQQIWLAGLGAFSKAQEEGGKVFEVLVKEGLALQRKTQAAAEEKISEASSKVSTMASGIQSKAGYQWDKLENIFEDRVAKALNKLGVPSAKDLDALMARIDALNKNIEKASAKAPATKTAGRKTKAAPIPTPAAPAAKKATRKTTAKRAAPRKSV
jgi:poly(hydroxyalkanoate) granule-associated protein